ncbi:unnamed protein product, partial [Ectocarpus fasciculatus]
TTDPWFPHQKKRNLFLGKTFVLPTEKKHHLCNSFLLAPGEQLLRALILRSTSASYKYSRFRPSLASLVSMPALMFPYTTTGNTTTAMRSPRETLGVKVNVFSEISRFPIHS